MIDVPASLQWWREEPGGGAWLDRLPRLVAECAEEWSLEIGAPFRGGNVALVLAASLPEGRPAVLKVNFPEPESEREPEALLHWRGEGAALLLAHDHERRALLVERCLPGTRLWEEPEEDTANRIAAGILRRLWRPPPPDHLFLRLAEVAERWAEELPVSWAAAGRTFERELVDQGVAALRELGPDQGEAVVLHQDFHGGNVLRATREPWLAIDPKPIVGEREFDAASLLRDRRPLPPEDEHVVRGRLDLLAYELELDRERMRRWGIAHALAWGVSGTTGKVERDMVACARILARLGA